LIHLDTSFLIRALVRDSREDERLRAFLGAGESLAMSTVAWAEFLCGPVEAPLLELVGQIVTRLVPFGEDTAALAADLFNQTGRRRGSLADCMIAATAIRAKATLATHNPVDFRRFQAAGLELARP
jgi:predicted nucleic acid-binding protein